MYNLFKQQQDRSANEVASISYVVSKRVDEFRRPEGAQPTRFVHEQQSQMSCANHRSDLTEKDIGSHVVQLKRPRRRLFRNSEKLSLAEFHNLADPSTPGQAWRRWLHTGGDVGQGSSATHKPASTYAIPRTLSHVTHYSALPSIRQKGLDPSFRNASSGLNARSGTVKYAGRDDHLRAVYLGTHAGIGTSMETDEQTDEGGRVELRANLPWAFRIKNMRQIPAVVGSSDRGFDDAASGNTALSFAKIPPKYLSAVRRGEGGKETLHRLTSLVGTKGQEYDFRRFATQPTKRHDSLPSNQDLLDIDERRRASVEASRRAAARMPPPEPVEADRSDADTGQVDKQRSQFMDALAARIQQATQMTRPAEEDQSEGEWGDD